MEVIDRSTSVGGKGAPDGEGGGGPVDSLRNGAPGADCGEHAVYGGVFGCVGCVIGGRGVYVGGEWKCSARDVLRGGPF